MQPVLEIDAIITLHYFEYAKNFCGIEEAHNFWELVYVDSGTIEATADDVRHRLTQNQVIFHKPFERHNVFVGDCFASTFILTFDCNSPGIAFFENKILKVAQKEQLLIGEMIREGQALFEEPLNIMDQVAMKKKPPDSALFGGEQILKNLIEQFLICLIRSHAALARPAANAWPAALAGPAALAPNAWVAAPAVLAAPAANAWPAANACARNAEVENLFCSVVRLLKKNIYKKISLDDISYQAFASRSCIEKAFRKRTGGGVMHYFNQLKICEAKRLLSLGYTITATADKLHFSSVHYFSKLFKQHTKMSPMAYKKSVQAQMLLL